MVKIFDTQLANVACHYAKLTNCRISKTTLQKDLEENPFYPSLLSLKKTFAKYNIPGKSFKISSAEFSQLNPPFLALLKINIKDKDLVLVTKVSGQTITYIYEKQLQKIVSKEAFFKDFQGIVWMAEPGEQGGEKDYELQLQEEKLALYKKIGLITGALFIFTALFYININNGNWLVFSIILLLKIIGCLITSILLLYEVDKNNTLIKSICAPGENKKVSCAAVLNSKASRIFGVGLGEFGFFYFASTGLLLLLPGFSINQKLFWLATANICASPFILFSLFYQWRIAKQWCKLCLAVQAVLAAELLSFLLFFWRKIYLPPITVTDVCVVACCIILPVISWYALKPVFIQAKEYKVVYPAFQRLNNDPAIFNTLLHNQSIIYPLPENLDLAIGNPAGTMEIVMVSDPYCGPCALAHGRLHTLLQQNKNIRLRIIFINENTATNKGAIVAKHLMAIASTNMNIIQALADWYSNRNYAEIVRKYPKQDTEIESQSVLLEKMYAWCIAAGIAYTPTIFINGYMLPDNYGPDDLKNIIMDC